MYEARAKALGHPIHTMLIPFPFGLLATSAIFDGMHVYTDNPLWATISYYMIVAGVISGILAAAFGIYDWMGLPRNSRAWRIGFFHGLGNELAMATWAVSWHLRQPDPSHPSTLALGLSFAAFAGACVTGWLGGELVDRMGVGVDPGANINAPSSLTHDTAQIPAR